MIIERAWSMPSRWTFQIDPIKKLLERYNPSKGWVDPFCGNSKLAEFRNDLNPENKIAESHKKAFEFLQSFTECSIEGVLFDPPYSPRQISECYKSIGLQVSMTDTQNQWTKEKDLIAKILKKDKFCISFGWNSNGIGKTRGFEIIEILLVAHGGSHNDTIVTVERKL